MERLYIATLLLYILVLVLSSCRVRVLPFLIVTAMIVNGWALALIIIRSGHLPVFSVFESFLLVSFILGFMGLIARDWGKGKPTAGTWLWLETVILLGLLWFVPRTPAINRYDYDYSWIVLFHGMRDVSLALVLFSSAHFIQSRLEGAKSVLGAGHFYRGRNYLLSGVIFFLISEFAGIIWCLNGWGDVWRWSTSFFQSTLIVLYFMLAFHVPGWNRHTDNAKSLIGSMSGFFMLILMAVRGLA
jgi:hypothetical protein